MPGVRVVFDGGECSVHVVLLDGGPLGYNPAAEEMAPSHAGLCGGKMLVFIWVLLEFEQGEVGGIKVRAEAGEE